MPSAALPVALRGVSLMIRADAAESLHAVMARVISVARAEQARLAASPRHRAPALTRFAPRAQILGPKETIRRILLLTDPSAVAMLIDPSFTAAELAAMLGLPGSRLVAVVRGPRAVAGPAAHCCGIAWRTRPNPECGRAG